MLKIHKKHIKIILIATAVAVILGFAAFFLYQNTLSREARIYAQEVKMLKNRLITSGDKPSPESVRVPILIYHSVRPFHIGIPANIKKFSIEPKMFERHLQYLASHGYSAISPEQLSNHLLAGAKLPSKPVLITFDDGWENQYLHALPLLKKYNFTAVFYVPTGAIGSRDIMSWQDIKELELSGMTIGSHTESHPFLTDATAKELEKEVAESKKILESHLQNPVLDFAFPYGQYNSAALQAVNEAGYRTARTTDYGVWQKPENILKLKASLIFNNFDGFLNAL